MKKFGLILFLIVWLKPVFGQLDNLLFEDRMLVDEADSGKLFAGLNFLGFSKNNEYFNTIIEGYTLLGYQLNPYASYHLAKHVRLDAGAYFQKDFGNQNFSTIAPTLTLKITKRDVALLFGNIESSLNHRLIEPLYDFERVMNNRLETGIQFQTMTENLFIDLWVDWQNMIYNRDVEQERFVSGLSFAKDITKNDWPVTLITQFVVGHKGGQINNSSLPLETAMNSAAGLQLSHNSRSFVSQWTWNMFHVYYDNLSSVVERPYKDGSAIYVNANAATRVGLSIMISYWKSHEFLSVQGGKVYPSVSVFDSRVQREKMELMIMRFLYQREVSKGLQLALRLEPYYDIGFGSFQYAYGFYLQFNDRFFLTKIK